MSADADGGQEADAHHFKSPVRCAEGRISRRTGAFGKAKSGSFVPNATRFDDTQGEEDRRTP
jgi:hypothetical protein